jgi:hypothetical protein
LKVEAQYFVNWLFKTSHFGSKLLSLLILFRQIDIGILFLFETNASSKLILLNLKFVESTFREDIGFPFTKTESTVPAASGFAVTTSLCKMCRSF